MELILQQVVNGVAIGMSYALVALGLTLIFGVLHVVNFAHGDFYMLGGFAAVLAGQFLGVPYASTILAAVLATAAVAWIVDRLAVRPVLDTTDGASTVLLSTFAVSLLLHNAVLVFQGPTPVRIDGVSGSLTIANLTITYHRVLIVAAGLVALVAVEWVLRRTMFGKRARALAMNGFAARVVGFDVDRVRTGIFVISAALAGFAGALIAPLVLFTPAMGLNIIIKAFVVVIVGGMGSVTGAVICGVALGIIEAVASIWLAEEVTAAFIYSLLLVTLLVRPQGLLGGTR